MTGYVATDIVLRLVKVDGRTRVEYASAIYVDLPQEVGMQFPPQLIVGK